MSANPPVPPPFAIIAGFGVPGRAAHEALCTAGWQVSVIERNARTVQRCQHGMDIREGDATEPQTLQEVGLTAAKLLVIALPDEATTLKCVDAARTLNREVKIIARTYFTSSAYEAKRRGADEVVIAEQVIATAMGERVRDALGPVPAAAQPSEDPS